MEWLARAGWMVYPIGLCAVAALTLFFERWFSLSPRRVAPEGWRAEVLAQMRRDEAPTGLERAAAGRLVVAWLKSADRRRERVGEAGQRLVVEMERGISWLATIASLAPGDGARYDRGVSAHDRGRRRRLPAARRGYLDGARDDCFGHVGRHAHAGLASPAARARASARERP